MHARTLAIGGLAVALAAGVAGPAMAAPTNGDAITLTCDSGLAVSAATVGNGKWTPALFTDGNQVAVPIAFDGFSVVATDINTNAVLAEFSDPTVTTKNAQMRGRVVDHCVFSGSFVNHGDPDFNGADVRYTYSGGVTATFKK